MSHSFTKTECNICFEISSTTQTHCEKDICTSCVSKITECPFCRKKENFMKMPQDVDFKKTNFYDFIYNNNLTGKLVTCLAKDSYQMEFHYYQKYTTSEVFLMRYIKTYASAYMFEPVLQFETIINNKKVEICFNLRNAEKFQFYLPNTEISFDVEQYVSKLREL